MTTTNTNTIGPGTKNYTRLNILSLCYVCFCFGGREGLVIINSGTAVVVTHNTEDDVFDEGVDVDVDVEDNDLEREVV